MSVPTLHPHWLTPGPADHQICPSPTDTAVQTGTPKPSEVWPVIIGITIITYMYI